MDSKRLLELCQERGITYSEKQLRDYHKAGLIPKPETKSLGRAKGTSTEYPDNTIEILVFINSLQNRGITRYDDIIWNLFMAGFNHISVGRIKEIILETGIIEKIKNAKEKITDEFDALDVANQIVESERGKEIADLIPKNFSSLSNKELEPLLMGFMRTAMGDISFLKEIENEAEMEYLGSIYRDKLEKIKNDVTNDLVLFLRPLLDEKFLAELQGYLNSIKKGFTPKLVNFAGVAEGFNQINPLTLRTARIYIKLISTFINFQVDKKEASFLIPLVIKMQIKNKYILTENELKLLENIIFNGNNLLLNDFMKISGILFNR